MNGAEGILAEMERIDEELRTIDDFEVAVGLFANRQMLLSTLADGLAQLSDEPVLRQVQVRGAEILEDWLRKRDDLQRQGQELYSSQLMLRSMLPGRRACWLDCTG